jgi:very-short-patch-repair endonuclease
MVNDDIDRAAAALSRRQHGAFAARQLLAAGATRSLITRRVAAGHWIRLETGVFAMPGNPGTWRRQVKAAELGHPDASVSGATAAVLHPLAGFRPGRPEVTVPHGCEYRTTLARVRRRNGVAVTTAAGFRLTDLPQTLLDVAAETTAAALQAALEDALLRAIVDPDELLRRTIEAGQRRTRGAGALRRVLDELLGSEAIKETDLERLLRRALDRSGVEPVVYQAPPPWWPDGPQRVDALLPEHLTIVEADGRAWHTRVADFERDRERDNLAAVRGHRVVRLTWRALTTELPGTIGRLRALPRASITNIGTISLDVRS